MTNPNKLQNVMNRASRTISRIDKELNNLTLAQDKLSIESPEYYIISRAKGYLSDAQKDLQIVVNRIKTR